MNKVLPGVYLGNYRDSKDTAQLDRHKITHIVAIHDAARRVYPDKEYLCIMASDSPYQNLSQYFSACNDFIHTARVKGGNVLIHCLAGMSRSVTIVVAYIMSITSFQLEEAQKVVRGARPVSNPNSGFQKQLQEFESSQRLFEKRNGTKIMNFQFNAEKERLLLGLNPKFMLRTTFLESDIEHCKKLLVSYNNLLLSRAICEGRCHSARVCPTGTCRTRYPLPSPRLSRLRSAESVDSGTTSGSGSPSSSPSLTKKLSPASSSGYLCESPTRKSPTQSQSPQSSPSTNPPWERHYGCWKEHVKFRQQQQELMSSTAAARSSNSTPASPIHYNRVSKSGRSDSMISITSTTSILSLPAHLQADSFPQFDPNRKVSPTSPRISSPLPSPIHRKDMVSNPRSCPATPRRTPTARRQLPKTGASGPAILRPTSNSPRRPRMPCPPTHEEEDETLTVVFDQPISGRDSSASSSIKSWSHVSTSSMNNSPKSRMLPVQISPSASPKTGSGRTLPVHVSPGSSSRSGRKLPAQGSPVSVSCSKTGRTLPTQTQTPSPSSSKNVRALPTPVPHASNNVSSRPTTGITRWVMKRSAYYKDNF